MSLHAQSQNATLRPAPPPDRLLVDELALSELLNLSRGTVRRLVASGHLRPVALPGGIHRSLYRLADARAFVDSLASVAPRGTAETQAAPS
jgi:excisionase family DNA binding protein